MDLFDFNHSQDEERDQPFRFQDDNFDNPPSNENFFERELENGIEEEDFSMGMFDDSGQNAEREEMERESEPYSDQKSMHYSHCYAQPEPVRYQNLNADQDEAHYSQSHPEPESMQHREDYLKGNHGDSHESYLQPDPEQYSQLDHEQYLQTDPENYSGPDLENYLEPHPENCSEPRPENYSDPLPESDTVRYADTEPHPGFTIDVKGKLSMLKEEYANVMKAFVARREKDAKLIEAFRHKLLNTAVMGVAEVERVIEANNQLVNEEIRNIATQIQEDFYKIQATDEDLRTIKQTLKDLIARTGVSSQ